MITKFLTRYFHTGANMWAAQTSALATLRKKTGYTFANCKKALEMHDNDITKAESWLKEQAQSLGWSKATKLQGRQTTQGLVGVMIKDNVGAMVEVNCETDFVARNENFQDMVELATRTCVQLASVSRGSSDSIFKIALDKDLLQTLKTSDGKPLSDCLALMIGTVGENATLRRAMFFKAENNVQLFGYAHPTGITKGTSLLGRVGGIIAIRHTSGKLYEIEETAKKLCQHIVGMAPKKIGTPDDEPQKDKDEETCLIHQEYLHDDGVTVGEVLEENKLEVLDFMRFECGEENGTERTLEGLKTCQ